MEAAFYMEIQKSSQKNLRPLYIRPKQMPDLFGISERQVRQLMMRGDLKEGLHWFKKTSRMVLLSVQALEEWIKED
jgi:hypothetical protein